MDDDSPVEIADYVAARKKLCGSPTSEPAPRTMSKRDFWALEAFGTPDELRQAIFAQLDGVAHYYPKSIKHG